MMTGYQQRLTRLGFSFERGGPHLSRTMMLEELRALLAFVDQPEAEKGDYLQAISADNCLGKRSGKTRALSCRHLVDLYSLDANLLLFRALRAFWHRDCSGQPLLALLCAYARDAVLRATTPFILSSPEGTTIRRAALEEYIDHLEPGRFSRATLKSTAQNLNATFTQSGHLQGRARKVRSQARATMGSVAYALLLGYLSGSRGQMLFQTEYAKLLDCGFDVALELAESASRKGWIMVKRAGDIIEVLFSNLMNKREMEWLFEQD